MNVSDQILDEIKERWANDIKWLEFVEKNAKESDFKLNVTHPAKDIRYLLNRLEAAEKAARATAAMNQKLLGKIKDCLHKKGNDGCDLTEGYCCLPANCDDYLTP